MSDPERGNDNLEPDELRTDDLVRRARRDGGQSFGDLYARIAPALFAWANMRVLPALRSKLDPEDLLQEICCRAFERFSTYDESKAGFRSWSFGIANNVLKEWLFQLRGLPIAARPADEENDGRFDIESVPEDATTVSRRVAHDESLKQLVIRLEALPDDDKKLFIHRGLEGRRHEDVAELLGITTSLAEKRWQRLRDTLRELGLPDALIK